MTAGPATDHEDRTAGSGRRRVLEQAAWLFLRRGYRDTTLRDIAAAAGMKAGSIYYHFDSKEQLLAAVLDEGIGRISDSFTETADSIPDGTAPRERLRRHVLAHLTALFEHGPFTTCHVTVFHGAPAAVRELGVPSRDAYEKRWAELLQGFADGGHLRAGLDLRLHRIMLLGAANSTLDWFDPGGNRTLDELADALTDQFWTGVAAPGEHRHERGRTTTTTTTTTTGARRPSSRTRPTERTTRGTT